MAIITLTSDLGFKDFYLAAVKGNILRKIPKAQIVDISHQIPSFNILQAAFILSNSFRHFPEGTIHLVSVDTGYQQKPSYIAFACEGHYFIGPDNGLFSLVFDYYPDLIVTLDAIQPESSVAHFPLADVFIQAASLLLSGAKLESLGSKVPDMQRRGILQPVIQETIIKGSVVYIDSFQNAITNIRKEQFEAARKGRKFDIVFRRGEVITLISKHYNDVTEGERLALWGSSDYLEIAMNKGKAAGLLGLNIGESIIIEFRDNSPAF